MANALRLLLALTLAAGLTSCGGGDSSSAPPGLDPAVANELASASEDVATAIEQGRCAEPAARELERRANGAAVPASVRIEVRRVVDRAAISCLAAAPPPPPAPTVEDEGDEDGDHGRGKGHDKHDKHEKKHGHGHRKDGDD